MSLTVAPRARYMILCDEVLPDETRPGKFTIVGLTTLVTWPTGSTTPVRLERLVVFMILTGGRGTGMGQVVCFNEESGVMVFGSTPKSISFEGKDPAGLHGLIIRILDCQFRQPGVYVVRFLFDEVSVCEQLITVR
jgi:hypothetical protein